MPGDKEEDALNEANLLGEASFGVFWGGQGLKTLMTIVDKEPELLPLLEIRCDSSKEKLSIEKFLTILQKLQVRL
jgi:hypothetical protein